MGIEEAFFGANGSSEKASQPTTDNHQPTESGMATKDIPVGLRVLVEHSQQPLMKASSYRKSITSTDSFNSSYQNNSGSFSGNASLFSGKLFSGSASSAFNNVTSHISSLKTLSYQEESSTSEFNPNFLQVVREVTTEATIDGNVAKMVETKVVDCVPNNSPLSSKDLQKKSEEYIQLYDNGSGNGIKNGSICSFTATDHLKVKEQPPATYHGTIYGDWMGNRDWAIRGYPLSNGFKVFATNSSGTLKMVGVHADGSQEGRCKQNFTGNITPEVVKQAWNSPTDVVGGHYRVKNIYKL